MRIVIQRVKKAKVEVENKIVGKIDKGYLILLGIGKEDRKEDADYLVKKICNLRIFEDQNGKMNKSIKDVNGEILIVSQFTLYANCLNGNRPSFVEAAKPDEAKKLYEYFCLECEKNGMKVEKGVFGADMKVSLINDGPVTIVIDKD